MSKKRKRPSKLAENLAICIKKQRTQVGITQSVLAEKVGVEMETISRIERGTATPSLLKLEEIAEALGVGIAELIAASSSLARDQAVQLEGWLQPLDEHERALVLDVARKQSEFFLGSRNRKKLKK